MASASIPKIRLLAGKAVNEFCHVSVLFSELMPVELATGVLRNKKYRRSMRA